MRFWICLLLPELLTFLSAAGQYIKLVTILENSEIGTTVYDLEERLLQDVAPEALANVTAYAAQQDLFWPFALQGLRIVVARPLDREAICNRQGGTRVKDLLTSDNRQNDDTCPKWHCCQLLHVNVLVSSTSPTRVFVVRVAVQDVNDNAPIFLSIDVPFVVIPEDIQVGHRVFLPQATDADSEQNGIIEYRISKWIQGNASHFQMGILSAEEEEFELSRKSIRPYLTVVYPLDRESEDIYEFILEAIDGRDAMFSRQIVNQRPSTWAVNIVLRIKDINDNAPIFDERIYKNVLQENTRPQKVIEFKLFDPDAGENGRVFVNIFDPLNHTNNLFRVVLQNAQAHDYMTKYQEAASSKPQGSFYNGYLHQLDYLDAETLPPRLRFFLVATDNGQIQLSSKVEVNLELLNVNDQAPNIIFLQEGKRLTENQLVLPETLTPPGAMVAEVHVTDADSSLALLTCRITREFDAFKLIEVTALNGQENENSFSGLGRQSSSFLYSSYRQFSLQNKHVLDREMRSTYLVGIMCSDNEPIDPLSRNASLHIRVSDINDETPKFEHAIYTGHVKENDPNAAIRLIQPLRTSDGDVGRNALITYSIRDLEVTANGTAPTSDTSFFRVDPRLGNLWTTSPLDCETKDVYSFLLIATDDGLPEKRSSSAVVNIIVDDVNDNPPEFDQYHYSFEVEENAPTGTVIGKVVVHDADKTEANQRVRYSLRGRPEDLFLVDIDRSSGELSMRRRVDYEKLSSITLTVVAENESPLFQVTGLDHLGKTVSRHGYQMHSAEASLLVTVINVNDNRPEFVPISPNKKHIVFIWEQLPVVTDVIPTSSQNENDTSGNKTDISTTAIPTHFVKMNRPKFCEPIPYKVIDKDCGLATQEFCCSLSLENTFDDMFGLIEEVPSVLCALKRPPQPQSYKVTLVARDGMGKNSLSSKIQLSLIIKSGADYSRYPPHLPLSSSSSDEGHLTKKSNLKSYLNGGTDVERPGQTVSNVGYFERQKHSSGRPTTAPESPSNSTASSHQMKIISILVSVTGVFCILLLVIVVTIKCGVLDGQNFSFVKTSENPDTVQKLSDQGRMAQFAPKLDAGILPHQNRPPMDEYRTLGDCFPEVLYMDQKFPQKRNTGTRDGTYEISGAFTTARSSNADNNYSSNVIMANDIHQRFATLSSPKVFHGSGCVKQQSQPMLVAKLQPSDGSLRNLSRGPLTAYLKEGRLVSPNSFNPHQIPYPSDMQTPTFYSPADAYQTLDPLTLAKSSPQCMGNRGGKKCQKEPIEPKVTFNLEMFAIRASGREEEETEVIEEENGKSVSLLKNDISSPDCENMEHDEKIATSHLTNLVYGKSAHHSSYV